MNLFFRSLTHKLSRLLSKANVVLLGTLVIIPFQGKQVFAAEEIVFKYGIASHSVSIEELEQFAATGKMSRSVRFLFDFTKQNPQIARRILVQEFPVETVIVSDLANSVPGEAVLSGVSQLIYPKSDRTRIEALRGALVVSASDDNKVSLIELFRNYPTQQMYVDGKLLSTTAKDVNNIIEIFEESLKVSFNLIVGEIKQIPESLLPEVLDFIQSLKHKHEREKLETALYEIEKRMKFWRSQIPKCLALRDRSLKKISYIL